MLTLIFVKLVVYLLFFFQNGFLWIVVEQYNNKTMDENDATDANTPRDAITTMEAAADEVILRMI